MTHGFRMISGLSGGRRFKHPSSPSSIKIKSTGSLVRLIAPLSQCIVCPIDVALKKAAEEACKAVINPASLSLIPLPLPPREANHCYRKRAALNMRRPSQLKPICCEVMWDGGGWGGRGGYFHSHNFSELNFEKRKEKKKRVNLPSYALLL